MIIYRIMEAIFTSSLPLIFRNDHGDNGKYYTEMRLLANRRLFQ